MRWVAVSAAIEAATGLVLIFKPSALAWLLLGADLTLAGDAVGRIAGFALLSLGWACRPKGNAGGGDALLALLIYNGLTTVFLAYLALAGELIGPLLWPAIALHAILSVLLLRAQIAPPAK